MANQFIAINRGKDGFKASDFVTGAASTAAADFELRIATVDLQGAVPKRKDVVIALEAFLRVLEQGKDIMNFPPL